MAYEYNIPNVDLGNEFNKDDGADAYFDINEQLEQKLILSEPEQDLESKNSSEEENDYLESDKPEVSTSDSYVLDTEERKLEKKENAVLQEITSNIQNIRHLSETKKRKNDADHRVIKFISLAEGVREFQGHIRETSHSHSRGIGGKKDHTNSVAKHHVTIPQSPLLLSKTRTRPVNYPSAEERVLKEIEEIESFKLKAKPVNKKIFQPPQLGLRIARAPLVVEPFNLTEYKKKVVQESSSPYQFKAKPVPKAMLQHPCGIPEKKSLPITSPHAPSFVSKLKIKFQTIEEVDGRLILRESSPSHTNVSMTARACEKTLPQPFSFEERDKQMIKNKEEKIKKVFEEEKAARIFHANPIPSFIKKCTKDLSNDSRSPSKISLSNDENKKPAFKAQPATVLHKEPFKPKLPERSFTTSDNVFLHTEHRAQNRKEYDEHLKQRAEEIEAELLRRKELEEKKQEEEVALLRQQAVHKAQPIRTYRPVPERQKTVVTSPSTPKFSERFKK